MKQRIVLAYSGDLASSVAIAWLAEQRGAEIVTMTLDIGQRLELDEVRARALTIGATRAHVLDVREEFARDYVLPAVRAGTWDARRSGAITSLAAPLVARKLAEIAAIENATAVADFGRESGMTVHAQQEYARAHGIPMPSTPAARIKEPSMACDTAAHVEISFANGVAVEINGIPMRATELLESLTTIAGEHRIGSVNDFYMPAAIVLQTAYTAGDASQLTGTVRLKLFKGTCEVVGRTAVPAAENIDQSATVART